MCNPFTCSAVFKSPKWWWNCSKCGKPYIREKKEVLFFHTPFLEWIITANSCITRCNRSGRHTTVESWLYRKIATSFPRFLEWRLKNYFLAMQQWKNVRMFLVWKYPQSRFSGQKLAYLRKNLCVLQKDSTVEVMTDAHRIPRSVKTLNKQT